MEMKMAELTGSELDKLMTDYESPFRGFQTARWFLPYESDIRAILNGFKFDESMGDAYFRSFLEGKNTRLVFGENAA